MDLSLPGKNKANYVPLSPISFLRRVARVYPQREAIIYGETRRTWGEVWRRCAQFAAALQKHGIGRGDTVSFVAANTPELIEAHFAIPMAGAVLNSNNVRLDAAVLRYIFEHSESKIIFVDGEFAPKVRDAVAAMKRPPRLVDIVDDDGNNRIGEMTYEQFLHSAGGEELCLMPEDERAPIALNYTSGTTGAPKGVVYHHRGAYLMSLGSVVAWDLRMHNRYLYTVPLFHCNGWGYVWTQALLAGTCICIRKIDGRQILRLIKRHRISALGGAPVVLSLITEAGRGEKLPHAVKLMTAGAPPPPPILQAAEAMGFEVTHVYGLTETFGHTTLCAWQEEWDSLPRDERAEMKARQGVGYPILEEWDVIDAEGRPVPANGKSLGEIVLRGNTIMSGYLNNPEATAAVFAREGWFKTGDLAVKHPDGYLQVKDRLKDIIISGGENISSIAVENALCKHPAVALAAVVAKADDKWGETPCAFVELKIDAEAPDERRLIDFCKEHLPSFMRPKYVVFGVLPKTATGKIKKYELRRAAEKIPARV